MNYNNLFKVAIKAILSHKSRTLLSMLGIIIGVAAVIVMMAIGQGSKESIKANTNWVVFEPNDATLWQRVNMTVSSFLDSMWRTGMLAGSSASEAYFVEIGPSTMARDDIMNGRLICNIGIAPSRPAEFVVFRVTQHTSEASGGGEAEE